ncbi:origin recognition complex subunit 1 [Exophiala aquamarina CBS 119918]|uniref:Origin recognition complex subunit 1 n=1 Tax=Exophiala aquamarina CBS 119918 TaxID=1182545 RepID=A0A072P1T4_9EURO|nr:origin recognition complex subunit 1 [Exophiala aquamarina CBS 119918]KEF54089.1 origin recognition complex subunit 1 [Exophiala aquamarina CBS 119918]
MQKVKRYSTKGGLQREDSDDELGSEDHPWEWIYSSDESNLPPEEESRNVRKRKASALKDSSKNATNIIGAQMGSFSVRVGDAILLKSPEQGKDWVALTCSFSETNEDDEDEMSVYVQWFCSPEELAFGKRSKIRPDVLPNESYITTDFNMNPLTAINGKATVLSRDAFFHKYPAGAPPKSKSAANLYAKTILCRRGVKQRTLRFTQEIVWDEIYKGPEDLLALIDWVKDQTKGRKPPREGDHDYEEKREAGDDEVPITPRKRRKMTAVSTPKSSAKVSKYTTPTHKRIMVKKPIEITPLGTRILTPSQYTSTPYSQARTTLHVSAVPTSLPCRSNEFSAVYSHLYSAIADGSGACIYISGTPGTGKTATVREVVGSLHQAVLDEELDDFNFIEINGMKVTEPHQSYSLLWEALKGDRVSPNHALSLLEQEFSHPSPRRIPCVVLMDELDQLVTKNQSVMYNFFNWPAMRHSRLIVLAVANTMDLPERTLSNKISSRLGLTRITFPGYTHTQLMEIISSRLAGVPGNIVDQDAIQFASRKVAAVSGDARRALDICRRAVELTEQSQPKSELSTGDEDEPSSNTPSRKGRNEAKQHENEAVGGEKRLPRVTIATIKQAINEATSSPLAQHLRSVSLSSKLFLAAVLARLRRTGIAESTLGDVLVEAKHIADMAETGLVHEFLLLDSETEKRADILPKVLALSGAAIGLVEAGIIAMEGRGRGERASKIRLRIGEEEVKSALMGDLEAKGLGFGA